MISSIVTLLCVVHSPYTNITLCLTYTTLALQICETYFFTNMKGMLWTCKLHYLSKSDSCTIGASFYHSFIAIILLIIYLLWLFMEYKAFFPCTQLPEVSLALIILSYIICTGSVKFFGSITPSIKIYIKHICHSFSPIPPFCHTLLHMHTTSLTQFVLRF